MESKITTKQVEKAVSALFKNKKKESEDDLLGSDVGYINLDITTDKILNKKKLDPKLLPLEFSAYMEGVEVCLFVKDEADKFKEKLKAQGVEEVKEVISVLDLKTKYKTYEARRKLASSYNLFLADDRVIHLMPKLLGKSFLSIGKNPIGIRVNRGNVKLAVEKIMNAATFTPNNGTLNTIKIGNFTMSEKDVVSNITSAIPKFVKEAASTWDNVRQIGVKAKSTPLLPFYVAIPKLENEEKEKKTPSTKKTTKKEAEKTTAKNKASDAKEAEVVEDKVPSTKKTPANKKKAPAAAEKKSPAVKKTPVTEEKKTSSETKSVGQKRKAVETPAEEKKPKTTKSAKSVQPAKAAKATKAKPVKKSTK